MEAAPLRHQLPSLGTVDVEKVKRDEDAYQSRNIGVTSNMPPSTAPPADSTYHYPQGPPPPYSHLTTSQKAALDAGTPPDSRRPSGEKDVAAQPMKQSLPSISEALGVDNQSSYQTSLPAPTSAAPPPLLPLQAPVQPPMRSYAAEPPQTNGDMASSHAYPAQPRYQPSELPRPMFADVRPALHLSTPQSTAYHSKPPPPATSSYSHPHPPANTSPIYERSSQPSGSFTYGYTPYPSRYQAGAASSSSNPGAVYQPSTMSSAQSWKADGPTRHNQERSYGESVKRHLDLYDLEAALNDITSTSSFLGDFSQRYGNLLHQSPRSGPQLSMLPSIIEVEDMISKSRAQTEALIKIRETVLAQQAAHDQEAAEQRHQKAYGDMAPPQHSGDSDDGKSNYGGPDTKKRRGRAAPPGRCHSCNRAETPEWRRGPDGARTLCNACGLHYAKLTRKQNNAGKPGAINSSNLRPKEHMP